LVLILRSQCFRCTGLMTPPSTTRLAAKNGPAVLLSRAIAIRDGYSSPAPWPSFATHDSTAQSDHGSHE